MAVLVVSLLASAGCDQGNRQAVSPPSSTTRPLPRVVFPSGDSVTVEVAIDDDERSRGLMFRESLAPDRGMLFIFDFPQERPFWMKNCRFPIDIIWLDQEQRFVGAKYSTPPCRADPCPNYSPGAAAMFVLEVDADVARRQKLEPGQQFQFIDLPLHRLSPEARAALEPAAPAESSPHS